MSIELETIIKVFEQDIERLKKEKEVLNEKIERRKEKLIQYKATLEYRNILGKTICTKPKKEDK